MSELVLILMLLPLIGCLFVLSAPDAKNNAYHVSLFTLITGIVIILRLFSLLDIEAPSLSFNFSYQWLENFKFDLYFGLDAFSLLLILAVYLSLIIGMSGLNESTRKNKMLLVLTLCFTSNITAFLSAGDLMSFYVFFASMLLPLFMLVGAYGNAKKIQTLYRFFLYNFMGILFLLLAALLLYKFYHGNVHLDRIAVIDMSHKAGLFVWSAVCLAFISLIPLWTFNYWIASVCVNIKNPLAYIMVNMLPLTGLYGFVRFWPLSVPDSIQLYLPFIEAMTIITMFFLALIGLASHEFLYKLFSYTTVYYLFFLLAVVLPTDALKMNIAYSLFIFLIVVSSLVVLDLQFEEKCQQKICGYRGILAYMPRFSLVISFFVLTAVGLPISSLFWNNFVLVSEIFYESFKIGLCVMMALTLVALGLLQELYVMRDLKKHEIGAENIEDLSSRQLVFTIGVVAILFLSFFNPLWFIF